ncbi:hypothetical protein BDN72DRAFT_961493 [Pluteus cervinus]|uniref:Uncharacterized protein n=1 Tax=Pluteus cervinus TaxID=181527 RepID=A0ACD3AME2_9AGAR|nr:hypothetical protein BDN72DRAFT_961493 [Pluteus cervinus]
MSQPLYTPQAPYNPSYPRPWKAAEDDTAYEEGPWSSTEFASSPHSSSDPMHINIKVNSKGEELVYVELEIPADAPEWFIKLLRTQFTPDGLIYDDRIQRIPDEPELSYSDSSSEQPSIYSGEESLPGGVPTGDDEPAALDLPIGPPQAGAGEITGDLDSARYVSNQILPRAQDLVAANSTVGLRSSEDSVVPTHKTRGPPPQGVVGQPISLGVGLGKTRVGAPGYSARSHSAIWLHRPLNGSDVQNLRDNQSNLRSVNAGALTTFIPNPAQDPRSPIPATWPPFERGSGQLPTPGLPVSWNCFELEHGTEAGINVQRAPSVTAAGRTSPPDTSSLSVLASISPGPVLSRPPGLRSPIRQLMPIASSSQIPPPHALQPIYTTEITASPLPIDPNMPLPEPLESPSSQYLSSSDRSLSEDGSLESPAGSTTESIHTQGPADVNVSIPIHEDSFNSSTSHSIHVPGYYSDSDRSEGLSSTAVEPSDSQSQITFIYYDDSNPLIWILNRAPILAWPIFVLGVCIPCYRLIIMVLCDIINGANSLP